MTPKMTIKVKTRTHTLIHNLFSAQACIIMTAYCRHFPLILWVIGFCSCSYYLHRDQKQHVWDGHKTLPCHRPSPTRLPQRRLFFFSSWSWCGAVRITMCQTTSGLLSLCCKALLGVHFLYYTAVQGADCSLLTAYLSLLHMDRCFRF